MKEEFLWVEKYRPQKIADTILPPQLKDVFTKIVESGKLPNMLFSGTAGLGKTTVAKALCSELDLDYIVVNGSEEGNIETLRGKIKRFASSVSLQGDFKVVILDEADYLNPQSTQPALRGFIEEFSDNCRFILTCNFKNRIIEPLHSRCSVYEFNTSKKDMIDLCQQMMIRVNTILDNEKADLQLSNQDLAELIMRYGPDWRRVINELQRFSIGGTQIDQSLSADNYAVLFKALKDKNFKTMRSWVANNVDVDTSTIFRHVYDHMNTVVVEASIPQLVLILADYQYKAAFVADNELNIVACMTEVMAGVDFL